MKINNHDIEIDKTLAKNKLKKFLKVSPLKRRPYAQGEKLLALRTKDGEDSRQE